LNVFFVNSTSDPISINASDVPYYGKVDYVVPPHSVSQCDVISGPEEINLYFMYGKSKAWKERDIKGKALISRTHGDDVVLEFPPVDSPNAPDDQVTDVVTSTKSHKS
jgi:hypothetical protein